MKRIQILKAVLLFVFAVILQTTVSDWVSILGIAPDFLLIFVAYQAFYRGPATGAAWGFFVGFAIDVYAPVEWLGSASLAMTVFGFFVGQLEEKFLTLKLVPRLFILAAGFLLYDVLYFSLTSISHGEMVHYLLTSTLPECLYTMLYGGIIFHFLFRGKRHSND